MNSLNKVLSISDYLNLSWSSEPELAKDLTKLVESDPQIKRFFYDTNKKKVLINPVSENIFYILEVTKEIEEMKMEDLHTHANNLLIKATQLLPSISSLLNKYRFQEKLWSNLISYYESRLRSTVTEDLENELFSSKFTDLEKSRNEILSKMESSKKIMDESQKKIELSICKEQLDSINKKEGVLFDLLKKKATQNYFASKTKENEMYLEFVRKRDIVSYIVSFFESTYRDFKEDINSLKIYIRENQETHV